MAPAAVAVNKSHELLGRTAAVPVGDLIVDRYRLDERIAAGGMGEVWRGTDLRLKRPVAIKMLHPGLSDNEEFRARFVSEATLVAALNTRSVAAVYDYGEEETADGTRAYLIMELVSGQSLADLLREKGRLSVAETTSLVTAAAEGLHAAHAVGIVHRDVKPANILITSHGVVKIIDFGIARNHGDTGLTDTGMVIGTVVYSAPEHLTDEDPAPSNDIYSLGIVAYECLTGTPPFVSEASAAVMFRHLTEEPPPLPDDVPEALSAAIMKALRKDRADRWETVREFGQACLDMSETDVSVASAPLAVAVADADADADEPDAEETPTVPDATDGPEEDGSPAAPEEPEKPDATSPPSTLPEGDTAEKRRRRRLLVSACVVVALLLAGFIAWQPWQGRSPLTGDGAGDGLPPASSSSQPSGTDQRSDDPEIDTSDGTGASPDGEKPTEEPDSTGDGDGEGDSGGGDPGGGDDTDPPDPTTAKVPDLTGVLVSEVADRLRNAGFDKSEGVREEGNSDMECKVYKQSPKAGSRVERDTTITYNYIDGFPFTDCWPDS